MLPHEPPCCTRCGATAGLETRYVVFGQRAYGVGWRCRDRDACRARQRLGCCEACGRQLHPGEGKVCSCCEARIRRGLRLVWQVAQ